MANKKIKLEEPYIVQVLDHLWKVSTVSLLNEVLENKGTWALRTPLNIFKDILAEVAERATEINDPILNALMLRLSLYEVSNPSSKEYDPSFVNDYIERHIKPKKQTVVRIIKK